MNASIVLTPEQAAVVMPLITERQYLSVHTHAEDKPITTT